MGINPIPSGIMNSTRKYLWAAKAKTLGLYLSYLKNAKRAQSAWCK